MGFTAKQLQIPAGGQAGYQAQFDAAITEDIKDAHLAMKKYGESHPDSYFGRYYDKWSPQYKAKRLRWNLEFAAVNAMGGNFWETDEIGYTPEIYKKAGYKEAAEKLEARNRAISSENTAVDALLEAQEESSAAAKFENEKKLLDRTSRGAGQSQARLMQRQQQLQADKLRPDLADSEHAKTSKNKLHSKPLKRFGQEFVGSALAVRAKTPEEIESLINSHKEYVRESTWSVDGPRSSGRARSRRYKRENPKQYVMPSSEDIRTRSASSSSETITNVTPQEARETAERMKNPHSENARRALAERDGIPYNDGIASSQVTEKKPEINPDSEGKPSNKAKWAKRGFIGVGMATLAAAGLAVNSLMINDKGRMNNAQMYGQQPYSQY